jgi:hypothetical protein
MNSTLRIVLIATMTLLVALAAILGLTERGDPVEAQSVYIDQGRYQFFQLTGSGHHAIFDTETGTLGEWAGNKSGDTYWTYSPNGGRNIRRARISLVQ